MPKCTGGKIGFGKFGRRLIEADFSGRDLSSDGGMVPKNLNWRHASSA
jgi:hypothetical protein